MTLLMFLYLLGDGFGFDVDLLSIRATYPTTPFVMNFDDPKNYTTKFDFGRFMAFGSSASMMPPWMGVRSVLAKRRYQML